MTRAEKTHPCRLGRMAVLGLSAAIANSGRIPPADRSRRNPSFSPADRRDVRGNCRAHRKTADGLVPSVLLRKIPSSHWGPTVGDASRRACERSRRRRFTHPPRSRRQNPPNPTGGECRRRSVVIGSREPRQRASGMRDRRRQRGSVGRRWGASPSTRRHHPRATVGGCVGGAIAAAVDSLMGEHSD